MRSSILCSARRSGKDTTGSVLADGGRSQIEVGLNDEESAGASAPVVLRALVVGRLLAADLDRRHANQPKDARMGDVHGVDAANACFCFG